MLNDKNKVILMYLLVHVHVSCVLYYVHIAELETVFQLFFNKGSKCG